MLSYVQVVPAVQQVIQPIPATPATPHTPRIITVRTPGPQQTHGPVANSLVTPITHSAAVPTVKVVQSTNPQGTRTPITKVIRVAGNSLLQRPPGVMPVVGGAGQNGAPRVIHRLVAPGTVVTPGTRLVSPSTPVRGGTPGQPHIITITRVNPSTGATTPGTPLNAKNVITIGQQGTSSASTPTGVTRKIFVTRNGQTLGPIVTTVNGQMPLTSVTRVLTTNSSGQQVIISANGHRQVMQMANQTSLVTSTTPSTARLVIPSVPETQPKPQTRILQSTPLGQLSSVLRSGSPVQIVSKTGLSGGRVVSATSVPSRPQSPGLHFSPSAPVLSNQVSLNSGPSSRSNSPGLGGNIPTVVHQPLGGGGSGLPIKATVVTSKDISRMWSNEDMRLRAFHTAAKHVSVG